MASNSSALVIPAPPPRGTNTVEATLRDIKSPVPIPNYWIYLWIFLGLMVLLSLAVLAWRLVKKQIASRPIAPPLPAHERARQKLQQALALIDQPKPFTVLVADTVRLYLEERFRFHAPEQTTEEFLLKLQASELLLPDQKQSLGEFLFRCDLVKFAQYEPARPELEDMLASAHRLIDETAPVPPAPHTPAEAAAA